MKWSSWPWPEWWITVVYAASEYAADLPKVVVAMVSLPRYTDDQLKPQYASWLPRAKARYRSWQR